MLDVKLYVFKISDVQIYGTILYLLIIHLNYYKTNAITILIDI